jgi:hypothetical protein
MRRSSAAGRDARPEIGKGLKEVSAMNVYSVASDGSPVLKGTTRAGLYFNGAHREGRSRHVFQNTIHVADVDELAKPVAGCACSRGAWPEPILTPREIAYRIGTIAFPWNGAPMLIEPGDLAPGIERAVILEAGQDPRHLPGWQPL